MVTRRTIFLMGILLILVLGYVSYSLWSWELRGFFSRMIDPPLGGKNSISALHVNQDAKGDWIAEFDYFYTGLPSHSILQIDLSGQESSRLIQGLKTIIPQRGQHHVSTTVPRPWGTNDSQIRTTQVHAKFKAGSEILASQTITKMIEWPDWQTAALNRELGTKSTDEVFKRAVSLIDFGNRTSLDEAKRILEQMTSRDPKFDAGYVELARVAMKTNWGPEGLHQAESLLQSALKINPESSNAKILLGYVFAHQKRYKQAEVLFEDVARVGSNNLWLWANWGELLVMQGQIDQAVQKYREAVTKPRTNDTYDRARLDAYEKLIALLEDRKDTYGTETLHKQRVAEFGNGSCDCRGVCYSAAYARFLLMHRNEANEAIALAQKALNSNCRKEEAREALGLAYYVAWAKETGAKRDEMLNQAHVYLPPGPRPLYLLSASDQTAGVVKKLIASGESVDQRDNTKQNALAYALESKDHQAVRRLLKHGARTDALVGFADVPIALVPVMNGDIESIRLMRQFGVDYSKVRFMGISALDHAKQIGDKKLVDALASSAI